MSARPLVIAGASRSGTSVLAKMISLHSQVRGLGEVHFFDQFRAVRNRDDVLTPAGAQRIAARLLHHALDEFYRPYSQEDHAETAGRLASSLSEPADADAVYRALLRHCGGSCRWVIDKTPRYVVWIPEILSTLPEALVVVITRDPRDVLLSQKRWYRTLWESRREVTRRIAMRHFLQYHPLTMSLLWRSAARADQLATDPRVIHIRFEDLVSDPRGAIEPLLSAMNLEFEQSMLDVERKASSNRPGLRPGSGVDPWVVGFWRANLSPTEQWINNRICGDLMPRYGYAVEAVRPTAWGLLQATLSFPLRSAVTLLLNIRRSQNVFRSTRRRLLL